MYILMKESSFIKRAVFSFFISLLLVTSECELLSVCMLSVTRRNCVPSQCCLIDQILTVLSLSVMPHQNSGYCDCEIL